MKSQSASRQKIPKSKSGCKLLLQCSKAKVFGQFPKVLEFVAAVFINYAGEPLLPSAAKSKTLPKGKIPLTIERAGKGKIKSFDYAKDIRL